MKDRAERLDKELKVVAVPEREVRGTTVTGFFLLPA